MIITNENFLIKEQKLVIPLSMKLGIGFNLNKLFIFVFCFIYTLGKGMIFHSIPNMYEFLIMFFFIIINVPVRRGNSLWINWRISRYKKKHIRQFIRKDNLFVLQRNIEHEQNILHLLIDEKVEIKKKEITKW